MVRVGQFVQARGGNDIEHVLPNAQHANAEHGENQRGRHDETRVDQRAVPGVFQYHGSCHDHGGSRNPAYRTRGNQRAALLTALRNQNGRLPRREHGSHGEDGIRTEHRVPAAAREQRE